MAIDWQAMHEYVGVCSDDIVKSFLSVAETTCWTLNHFRGNYPPRIVLVFQRSSGDGRKREKYRDASYWESDPPEEEMITIASLVAEVADEFGWSVRRNQTWDGRLHYTLKPKREQFEYPTGKEAT